MATSSIGTTARNYSTLQAWEDAIPATLLANEIGECYNDSEFATTASALTIAGITVGAFTITLTTGSGQSFRDHASVQSNPLKYDQSKGVGIKSTDAYVATVEINNTGVTIEKVQIYNATTSGSASTALFARSGSVATMRNLICQGDRGADIINDSGNGQLINVLVIQRASGSGNGIYFSYSSNTHVNLTVVRPSDKTAAGSAFRHDGSSGAILRNCAGFNFTNFASANFSASSSNNASDLAIGFGSSNQASKTYASQFENVLDATRDFRAKSGGDLVDTGVTDAINASTDILGTARPQGAAYDIGCHELVVAAVVTSTAVPFMTILSGQRL